MMELSMRADVNAVAVQGSHTNAVHLTPGDWGKQVVKRLNNPPLRFTGRSRSYHWRGFEPDQRVEIGMWERKQKGYVLGFSRLKDGELCVDAANLKTFGDAADFLEDLCTAEPAPPASQDQLFNLIADLCLKLHFRQQFALLVGDVLSDWEAMAAQAALNPRQKEPFQ